MSIIKTDRKPVVETKVEQPEIKVETPTEPKIEKPIMEPTKGGGGAMTQKQMITALIVVIVIIVIVVLAVYFYNKNKKAPLKTS